MTRSISAAWLPALYVLCSSCEGSTPPADVDSAPPASTSGPPASTGPTKPTPIAGVTPVLTAVAPKGEPLLPLGPRISFEPGDLTTLTTTTVPVVGIQEIPPEDTALTPALQAQLSLVTWPEMSPVSASPKITDERLVGVGRVVKIYLVSAAPLPDRWYAIRVARLPSGLEVSAGTRHRVLSDGALVVRFRPGSEPVLSAIVGCKKPGGEWSLGMSMSEPVLAVAGAKDVLTATSVGPAGEVGAPLPCTLVTGLTAPVSGLSVLCTTLDSGKPVRMGLSDGLQSTTGALAKAQAYSFKIDDLATAPECFRFGP